jgi:hypothetical protein
MSIKREKARLRATEGAFRPKVYAYFIDPSSPNSNVWSTNFRYIKMHYSAQTGVESNEV